MPDIGIGIDNSNTNSPTYTYFQLDTSAWALFNRAAMGISMDPISQSFTQVNPRYVPGYLGGFGYKSTASHPLLDHPLEMGILSKDSKSGGSKASWLAMYDLFLEFLNPELRKAMQETMQKPVSERDDGLVALNRSLIWGAQVFTQVGDTAEIPEPAKVLLTALTQNCISLGSNVGQQLQEYITELGPGYTDFDPIVNALNQMYIVMTELNGVMASLDTGKLTEEDKAKAAHVSDEFKRIAAQLSVAGITKNFQMLHSVLSSLSVFTGALALPFPGSAPLYVTLSIGAIGSETSALINPSWVSVVNAVTSGISSAVIPNANSASKNFLSLLTAYAATLAIGLAAQGEAVQSRYQTKAMSVIDPLLLATMMTGYSQMDFMSLLFAGTAFLTCIGLIPLMNVNDSGDLSTRELSEIERANIESAHFLTLATTSRLFSQSRLVDIFFEEAVAVCGGDDQAQALASPILTQLIGVLVVLAGTRHNKFYAAAEILKYSAKDLQIGVDALRHIVDKIQPGSSSQAITIAVKQLQADLGAMDYQAFIDTLLELLKNSGQSPEILRGDIERIVSIASMIRRTIQNNYDEYSLEMVKII